VTPAARRTAVLAAALAVALALVPAGPVGPAGAAPARQARPTIRLLDQSVVVAPDGTFSAFLSIEDAPTATEIAVDIYQRADPGDDLTTTDPAEREATFPAVALSGDATEDRTTGFAIELFGEGEDNPDPQWGWQLTEAGTYPVGIRLRDGDGAVLATLATQLIRLPDGDDPAASVDAALLVGVHAPPPAVREDRQATGQADETLRADLRRALAAIEARPDVPASFAVTPDTAARLEADPGDGDELARLRAVLAEPGRELLDAPFVDLDPTSLVAAGLGDLIGKERDLGRRTLARTLEPPTQGMWALDRPIDRAAADALRRRGVFRVVVPDGSLVAAPAGPGPVDVAAGTSTLRAWSTLPDDLLAATDGDPVLAAHRLLARLAAIGTGTPDARVVVPVDVATADPAALGLVLDALRFGLPFVRPTTVGAGFGTGPAGTARLAGARVTDLGQYPADLRAAEAALGSFTSMVGEDSDQVVSYRRFLDLSAADALDPAAAAADARWVRDALQVPFTAISIPARDKVTLGARDARFPISVTSDLDYPVDVVVEFQAGDRVVFPVARIPTTIEGPRSVIQVQVRVRTSGDTPVRVVVRSPDGGVVLAEGRYTIRSTAVSGVGLVLTIGAAVFLALWWGRHWHRSRRRPRHARRVRGRAGTATTDAPDDTASSDV
jgi:hypothetical protein